MKPYKLAVAAGLAAGLFVLSQGAVNAQSRNGGDCNGAGVCQMETQQDQGNNRQQGNGPVQGHGQGQGNRQGNANRQGEGNHQGHGGQGRGGQGNGNQGSGGRGAGPQAGNWEATLPPMTPGEVPDAVVAAMQDGLADEQDAYAVYAAVIEQFGNVRPFTNIQKAEAQHIAAWEFLFDRYGIAAPEAAQSEAPQFASLADACQAAAEAEIANRGLYDQMLDTMADYPDMTQVVTQLRTASDNNHLPAFERCAN